MNIYRSTFAKVFMGAIILVLGCNLSSTLAPLLLSRSNAVSSLEDVKSATVQIEAQGSFIDPQVGFQQNVAGRGSGFIASDAARDVHGAALPVYGRS